MSILIAVFKSKTEVFEFMDIMKNNGVPCTTTGTPKEAKIGCGLAVKFSQNYLGFAKQIIRNGFTSFYGIYSLSKMYGRSIISKVV